MEHNDKTDKEVLGLEAVTYVFSTQNEKSMEEPSQPGIRTKIWQIVPSICGK